MKATVSALLVLAAVLVQTVVINRLPLPWGVAPDVVLLAVVAIALWSTPAAGAVTGFAAGLAVDVLPPADHEVGRTALLLCLAGYLVARIHDSSARSGLGPYLAAAATALAVPAGFLLIAVVLGDPRAALPDALWQVLIGAALTVLLSPLVLGPVTPLMRRVTFDPYADLPTPWISAKGRAR
ncbi:rod shape-determining protein MreD [Streptomonospora wellingtoniae]|uniref:Rod shape-determining protein MreD n=1 Tax=Streptomonospora wellingtoniae TaxID=3075544 RepID=A0ABU2KPK5_9ACTN|nr:rod shape-determining protein MreD [Streptomonospora sp. DSM 45055]MDT0301197.1 rod shape-determining protein MreD [Streptomonospora sp. DSM 45055]